MRVTFSAALAAALLAAPAWAQSSDAGTPAPPPPPPGCGMVTPEGECVGNTVRYCDTSVTPNEVAEIDCVADVDPAAICQVISASYGVDCALATGSECIFADQNEDLFSAFCQGVGAGCVETAASSECVAGRTPCTMTDIGTCSANLAVIDCAEGQPWLLDCTSFNGTCAAGVCVGIPEGGACGDGIECAAGLTCSDDGECVAGGADGGMGGTDAGGNSPDATAGNADATSGGNPDATASGNADATSGGTADGGLPRADARTSGGGATPGKDDSGCTCVALPANDGLRLGLAALVLAGLALRRRR